MGNSTSRVVGCFAPFGKGKDAVELEFLEPLDEGLGHSFCYVRPVIVDSPGITPSNSERFILDSSTLDSETNNGSFRQDVVAEDCLGSQRGGKNFSETTFKTISGASVSANASTARTGNPNVLFLTDGQEPAASFESTASFAAIPLQPVPRGSGPLNGFMSGPLERGFASGPLDKWGNFMSGPLERGAFMSGPLESMDRSNFSAPLAYSRKSKIGLGRLMRSVSGPMRTAFSRTFTKHFADRGWMQRMFQPMSQFMGYPKESKYNPDASRNCVEVGPSESDYSESRNLQWAHGKAGEDRVHVVLSEEQGWLFVGIYDGFSGPDAPDFLMSNLYRAIDKELEGLLWDYEVKVEKESGVSSHLDGNTVDVSNDFAREACCNFESLNGDTEKITTEESVPVQLDEKSEAELGVTVDKELDNPQEEAKDRKEACQQITDTSNIEMGDDRNQNCLVGSCKVDMRSSDSACVSENNYSSTSSKFSAQGRKSMRLYELLQMEMMDEYAVDGSRSMSEVGSTRLDSFILRSEDFCCREPLPAAQLVSCSEKVKKPGSNNSCDLGKRENDDGVSEDLCNSKQKINDSFSTSGHRQMVRQSLIKGKLRKMYGKQKSLRKKLFPWSYDWHRDQIHIVEKTVGSSLAIRRCKSGPVDHDAVLRAMARALETTEEAYIEMVENTLDQNPELALMGSCVLVMLMKDQDVYVMNLGDSRVILAQEKLNDRHNNAGLKDDVRVCNRSRESLARVELDRISEESPMRDPNSKVHNVNKNQEISIYRSRMKALQLSTDHCTGIEEEVMRIKAEHLDDVQAIFNDRVKGQLKVTRAFGAGFLKKPKFNEALLEMFRIDYIGGSPYVSCIPAILHHQLCSSDRFLVLSSDGLYQYFSNDEVVSHVAWFMENVPEGDPAQYLIAELLLRAAKKNGMDFHELLDIPQGDRRKYHDDVSVMVISLEGRIWRSCG